MGCSRVARLDVGIVTIVAVADAVTGRATVGRPVWGPKFDLAVRRLRARAGRPTLCNDVGFTTGRRRRKIERGRMIVRIRLGSSLARLAPAPVLSLELPDGATVDDLYDCLASRTPELAAALAAALPLMDGKHVERGHRLTGGQEIALLTPVAGG